MLQGLFQAQQGDAAFVLEEVAHGGGPKVRSRARLGLRLRLRTGLRLRLRTEEGSREETAN
jgi:hypothetical protein